MKTETVLKSLGDLSPELVEPEADQPASWIPAGQSELRHIPSPVWEAEHFYPAGYQHWGINE
jgi:hypothetical protein